MPRKLKTIPGPSRLSKIIENLTRAPRPQLNSVKSLKVTLASRNDHFGARHFVKEDLPRIRYVNPALDIQVNKLPKSLQDSWQPEMIVEFRDGSTQTLNMNQKWSSAIFQELMDLGGGAPWQRWKKERIAAGLPIVDPPTVNVKPSQSMSTEEIIFGVGRPRTGAAAVLP
ncbi:uncharacterized protein FIBRA_08756 [Fibroporia radiculosa]|uniref:Ribosomal protein/NADH dehydrogenase domain-containing protein n=1 Tax=Fibroporia radiculosa TaxID=599839 RepID=J4I3A1_9APHY|nr:uncharacterized protein FIBRA_08756 [Fibroporia radiculosa]CCM06487.1 predicted protein [Fibroporia radiculosa]